MILNQGKDDDENRIMRRVEKGKEEGAHQSRAGDHMVESITSSIAEALLRSRLIQTREESSTVETKV